MVQTNDAATTTATTINPRPFSNGTQILHANRDTMGLCEDPFLFFDAAGNFHVFGHCYKCLDYPNPSCGSYTALMC